MEEYPRTRDLPAIDGTSRLSVYLNTGSLTSATVTSDSSGEARSTLMVANLASEVRVSACVGVAPQTACDIFYVYPVSAASGRVGAPIALSSLMV